MIFSQVIMFFIIVITVATLHAGRITSIQTASQAAEALRQLACDLAYMLTTRIIGTELLAVLVLVGSSAYAVAETAGMKEGLGKKPKLAPGFYILIAVLYTDRHIPWVTRDQAYNGPLLHGRIEWSGNSTADCARHHDREQEGCHGRVSQFKDKQCYGVDYRVNNDPSEGSADRQLETGK